MLARARGVPMVVGLGERARSTAMPRRSSTETSGLVVIEPRREQRSAFDRRLARADRPSGEAQRRYLDRARRHRRRRRRSQFIVNIADLDELDGLDPAHCDGIGLMRTEFLFRDGDRCRTRSASIAAYRRIAEWAAASR